MEDTKSKCRFFVFVAITAFMVFAPAGSGIESPIGPTPGSPVSNPAVPQTSLSRTGNELIPTPQVNYGAEGNRIVSGNVGGGRHFRHADGIVPYQSMEYFQYSDAEAANDLGLGFLNSFIRRSAGSGYPQQGLSLNEPYYFPSQTVTSMQRGTKSGLEPPRTTFPGGTDAFAPQIRPITDSQYFYGQQRPLSRSMEELEDVISREIGFQKKLTEAEEGSLEKEPTELEQVESYLAQQFKTTTDQKKGLFEEFFEPEKPVKPAKPDELKTEPDTAEQVKEEPKDFSEQLLKDAAEAEARNSDTPDTTQADKAPEEQKDKGKFEPPEVDPAVAAATRGPHKTFEDWAKAKFAEYMKVAEEFLRKGKYYKAADAYTLAGVYQRENPIAYLGKALALFAAGEYMSSSYYLERALTISPEYAKREVDLVQLLVDRDMIENRLIEIATWHQKTRSPELSFLMAYIFYQKKDIPTAKVAIKLASETEKMGTNPALLALQQAIGEAAGEKVR